jgi:hypothetical protein
MKHHAEADVGVLMARLGGAVSMRDRINAFEVEARKAPQIRLDLVHHFAPGIYCRELHIPAGVITTSKIHKFACLNILARGERTTLIGEQMVRVKAPFIYVSPAGFKRASITHEDAVWITVHENPTNERDIEALERALVCETEEEYLAFCRTVEAEQRPCLS